MIVTPIYKSQKQFITTIIISFDFLNDFEDI